MLAGFKSLKINLTYREEALNSLRVVEGERVRGGGGGVERQVHLGQRADPLPHLLPCRHGLAIPVEGARDEVSDLVLPLLSLPVQETVTKTTSLIRGSQQSTVSTLNIIQTKISKTRELNRKC